MEPDGFTEKEKPTLSRPAMLFISSIIGMQFLVGGIAYPFLPDKVPTHWNAAGQINGYGPKWMDTFLTPIISLGIYLLIRLLIKTSPQIHTGKRRAVEEIVDHILCGVFLLLLIVQLTVLSKAFNLATDSILIISITISALIIYIGNYMGKLQRNFWAGIRTPWTLASETVWERTHRFAGWLFVASGLIGLILSFIPEIRIWSIIILLPADALLATVHSYLIYQKLEAQGHPQP